MAVLFLLSNPYTFCLIFFFHYAGLDCQYNIEKVRKRHPCLINFKRNVYFFIKYEGFSKTGFWHICFGSLKKFPVTRAAEAQKVACPYVPICQIYTCHPRMIINSVPFHPQKGFSLDNKLYAPSNRRVMLYGDASKAIWSMIMRWVRGPWRFGQPAVSRMFSA